MAVQARQAPRPGAGEAAGAGQKAMVVEYGEYLTTACGRLYLAGEQIKAAARAYAATDMQAKAEFDAVMTDWDEPPAPRQARDWAGDTDRSGWWLRDK
ncbi:hypothetical protein BJY16_007431 [Actinoplanes octamycinicus]|uniref:Uncharacterized protein n=1 Tax=Actinoplanes octamycinicus TaxID=135948 RepID=A0A7W7MBF4_9ACTN|nr:hypothetical protein [Actinoplanes octamycinicus]MBB4743972.1 hypothetical protein [Actinoplanes octamycinicus]GIE58595.1 hypothetical protein Aoc01nite_39970 [Actinoplanes octamycinicus]